MATDRAKEEADIRKQIQELAEAVRAMEIEGVKSIYAPDMVTFDIVPPLQHSRAEAKWKNWADVFAAYQHPLGYEIRDLTIAVGDDVAFGRSLNRISGTLKSGKRSDFWLRWTTCFQKAQGNWRIVHDHVSVPLDMATGKAVLDLAP
jgi:ketosteroid isomerase-like protein